MNLYIWKQLDNLTEDYHNTGGAVVIAENEDEAYALIPEAEPYYNPKREPRKRTSPDAVFVLADAPPLEMPVEQVFIFPNAGCC